MSDRPTPRCNQEQFHRDNGHAREHSIVVSVEFARRLERQRDAYAETLRDLLNFAYEREREYIREKHPELAQEAKETS